MPITNQILNLKIGNQGRRARLCGESIDSNPYDEIKEEYEWLSWKTGYSTPEGGRLYPQPNAPGAAGNNTYGSGVHTPNEKRHF